MPNDQKNLVWRALGLAWEFGYLIAGPLVIFSVGGWYADRAFHTKPWLFLAGLVLSIPVVVIILVRKFSRLIRDLTPPPPKP